MAWQGVLEEYKEYLPVNDNTPNLTLYEGNTPLIKLEKLSEELGIELHAKFEGLNPTGSFKDRGMVLAVAKAKEEGAYCNLCVDRKYICRSISLCSTGLNSIVVLPEGKVALGKVTQAYDGRGQTITIDGNFDDALKNCQENF